MTDIILDQSHKGLSPIFSVDGKMCYWKQNIWSILF